MTLDKNFNVPEGIYGDDVEAVLVSQEDLHRRVSEMAQKVSDHYRDLGEELILVCVLKGAIYFLADFSRYVDIPVQLEFMAVSSYGSGATSSGVVRILKDLDRQIEGKHVLIVEDILDSGLTLSWVVRNLKARKPASLQVITLLRKPDAVRNEIELFDVGYDIPDEFVIGYGLDYAERYRDLPFVGTLNPRVYRE
ncbi:MAG: hypoxanthine phosphoribosyltransferase [Corynebacterium sp.]|nr:hypoxanthine phosphoribosyltransferase [Corynebacterium sp.]